MSSDFFEPLGVDFNQAMLARLNGALNSRFKGAVAMLVHMTPFQKCRVLYELIKGFVCFEKVMHPFGFPRSLGACSR